MRVRARACMCVCVGGVCRASVVEESGCIPSQLETSEIPNKRAIVIDKMQDQKLREIEKEISSPRNEQ